MGYTYNLSGGEISAILYLADDSYTYDIATAYQVEKGGEKRSLCSPSLMQPDYAEVSMYRLRPLKMESETTWLPETHTLL